jgi:hypothetical protein
MSHKVIIAFSNPKAWHLKLGARLIQFADKTPFSHVALIVQEASGVTVFESVFPRSRKIAYLDWVKRYSIEDSFIVEAENIDILESLVGKFYSLDQLVLILITNLFGWVDRVFNYAILNHERGLICTEVASRFLESISLWHVTESHDKIGIADVFKRCCELVDEGKAERCKWHG